RIERCVASAALRRQSIDGYLVRLALRKAGKQRWYREFISPFGLFLSRRAFLFGKRRISK
ncbi:MAG: hypothetical protein IJ995_01770, partial [Clostridia bacterium]|nr:hypothetical protein [Clostridia bacterium]